MPLNQRPLFPAQDPGGASAEERPADVIGPNGDLPTSFFVPERTADGPIKGKESTSPVWSIVFRLTAPGLAHFASTNNPQTMPTHVCLYRVNVGEAPCNTPLRLGVRKRRDLSGNEAIVGYVTTIAVDHVTNKHPQHSIAVAARARADGKKAAVGEVMKITGVLGASAGSSVGAAAAASSSDGMVQTTLNMFTHSPGDKSKAAQARFYIESSCRLSKNTFGSAAFVKLLEAHGTCYSKLDRRELINYVLAEYEIFVAQMKHMILLKQTQSLGNACAQLQHDGGTAKNSIKHQVFAMSFTDPSWSRPWVVAFAVVALEELDESGQKVPQKHTDVNVAKAVRTSFSIFSERPLEMVRSQHNPSHSLNG